MTSPTASTPSLQRPLAQRLGGSVAAGWSRIPDRWRWCLAVYAGSRVVVAAGIATAALVVRRATTVKATAIRWDGGWYLTIARYGYSKSLRLPHVYGPRHSHSEWAFFPAYPLVVRGVHALRLPYDVAGIGASLVIGFLAVVAVYVLGEACGGPAVGRWAAALVAVWPASAVFGLPYSEGLYVAASAVGLTALIRRRWWLAGLAGGVATASRASGVALIAAGCVAAGVAIARDRDFRALVAPVLSASGLAAFLAYGWARTGDLLVWRHAENLWRQRFDFGIGMYRNWAHAVVHPDAKYRTEASLEVFGAACLAAVAVAAWRRRRALSPTLVTYAVVSLVLMLGYSVVGTRPRMVLGVVPAFVWSAQWLRPAVTRWVVLALVPVLFATTFLYMWNATP